MSRLDVLGNAAVSLDEVVADLSRIGSAGEDDARDALRAVEREIEAAEATAVSGNEEETGG